MNNTENSSDHNAYAQELESKLRMIESTGVSDPFCFSSKKLIQATFPHSNRAGNELTLVNGNMIFTMYSRKGLPYGHYPRLIMCWLTREALRRNARLPLDEARRIPLGTSLNSFLEDIGIIKGMYSPKKKPADTTTAIVQTEDKAKRVHNPKKRASGDSYKALRTQMTRLFSTAISIDYTDQGRNGGKHGEGWDTVQVSEDGYLWWETEDGQLAPESYVTLTAKFFRQLVDEAVPLDPIHLAQISRSPLAIDLYSWATYRIATHRGFTRVTWEQLRGQIGASYPDTAQGRSDFRQNARKAFKKIQQIWPEGDMADWGGGLELRGHNPAVPKKAIDKFSKENALGDPGF